MSPLTHYNISWTLSTSRRDPQGLLLRMYKQWISRHPAVIRTTFHALLLQLISVQKSFKSFFSFSIDRNSSSSSTTILVFFLSFTFWFSSRRLLYPFLEFFVISPLPPSLLVPVPPTTTCFLGVGAPVVSRSLPVLQAPRLFEFFQYIL